MDIHTSQQQGRFDTGVNQERAEPACRLVRIGSAGAGIQPAENGPRLQQTQGNILQLRPRIGVDDQTGIDSPQTLGDHGNLGAAHILLGDRLALEVLLLVERPYRSG